MLTKAEGRKGFSSSSKGAIFKMRRRAGARLAVDQARRLPDRMDLRERAGQRLRLRGRPHRAQEVEASRALDLGAGPQPGRQLGRSSAAQAACQGQAREAVPARSDPHLAWEASKMLWAV